MYYIKFLITILFFSNRVNCGILNWFNTWSDELKQDNKNNCREIRDATSLLDIEDEGNLLKNNGAKFKRCPNNLGFLESTQKNNFAMFPSVTKRESESQNEILCKQCLAQVGCKVLKKCDSCQKYCKNNREIVSSSNTEKTVFPIASFTEDEITKNIICRIIGIENIKDIDTVSIFVTTFSNEAPTVSAHITAIDNKSNFNNNSRKEKKFEKFHPKENNEDTFKPELNSRFNDYDSGEEEESLNSGLRNLEEKVKINPDIIIGPPSPFSRSATKNLNFHNFLPKNSEPTQSQRNNNDLILQPKEFQSEENTVDVPNEPFLGTPLSEQNEKLLGKLPDITEPLKKVNEVIQNTLPEQSLIEKVSENKKLLGNSADVQINDANIDSTQKINKNKNKLEKYMENLKNRRQKQFSPDAFFKRLNNKEKNEKNETTPMDVTIFSRNSDNLVGQKNADNSNKVENEADTLMMRNAQNDNSNSNELNKANIPTEASDFFKKFLQTVRPTKIIIPADKVSPAELSKAIKQFNFLTNPANNKPPPSSSTNNDDDDDDDFKKRNSATSSSSDDNNNEENVGSTMEKNKLIKSLPLKNLLGFERKADAQKKELNSLRAKMFKLIKGEKLIKPVNNLLLGSFPNNNKEPSEEVSVTEIISTNPDEKSSTNLEMRSNKFPEDNNSSNKEINWSNHLGQIVQSPSTSKNGEEVFFVGGGVKLPMKLFKGENGDIDFSVDLDKLCSCKNSTCTKNHTAIIEETVGEILQKEAELKDQLIKNSNDDEKVLPEKRKRSLDLNANSLISTDPNQNLRKLILDSFKNENVIIKKLQDKEKPKKFIEAEILKTQNKLNNRIKEDAESYMKKLKKQQTFKNLLQQENNLKFKHEDLKKSFSNTYYNNNPLQDAQYNILENKLNSLQNELNKADEENGNFLMEKSKQLLAGHENKITENEVNLLVKLLKWLETLNTNNNEKIL